MSGMRVRLCSWPIVELASSSLKYTNPLFRAPDIALDTNMDWGGLFDLLVGGGEGGESFGQFKNFFHTDK